MNMAKGSLQIEYEKLVLDNLELKQRIKKLKELIGECIRIGGQNHWDAKRGSPENEVWQRLKRIYKASPERR